MRSRSNVLELAILGLLRSAPMHGYELRKRVNVMLGPFRAFSYGTLYPVLKALVGAEWIEESEPGEQGTRPRRGRIVYELTEKGAWRLESLLGEAGPATWEDEAFDVRFAFFAQIDVRTRVRILEGRRMRMAERLDAVKTREPKNPAMLDRYAFELHQHGIDQITREIEWLDSLIETERSELHLEPRNPLIEE